MSVFVQNIAVILIVGGCAGYVGWQAVAGLFGRKSKMGSCCAKGCSTVAAEQQKQAGSAGAKVQFMPVEMLTRKRSP